MRIALILLTLWVSGCAGSRQPHLDRSQKVSKISSLQLAADDSCLAVGSEDGAVSLFDLAGLPQASPPKAQGSVQQMAYRDGKLAYCGTQAPLIHLFNTRSHKHESSWAVGDLGKAAERIEHHAIIWVDGRTGAQSDKSYAYVGGREAGEVTSMAWLSPQRLLVNDLRGRVSWWDPPAKNPAGALPHPNPKGRYGYNLAAVSPDGTRVALVRFGGVGVEVYHLPDGQPLFRETSLQNVRVLQFSPDGSKLACSSGDKVLLMMSDSGVIHSEWQGFARSLHFSPDGQWLLAAGNHSRVYNLQTNQEMLKLGDCNDLVQLGSRPLVVALFSHGTTLYELPSGKRGPELSGSYRWAASSQDGKRLILADKENLHSWSIP